MIKRSISLAAALALLSAPALSQTVPFTFANQSGNVAASQLDSDFSYVLTYATNAANLTGTLSAAQFPALSGDCMSVAGNLGLTCTRTGGAPFGTFATANAANPPAIGTTTPNAVNASTLSATGAATLNGGVATTVISASGLITPNTTAGIKGTTLGDNANAGSDGEYISGTLPAATVPAPSTVTNCGSITLQAGDWNIQATFDFATTVGNISTGASGSISTTSGVLGPPGTQVTQNGQVGGLHEILATQLVRENPLSSATIFFVGFSAWGGVGNTMTCTVTYSARRAR